MSWLETQVQTDSIFGSSQVTVQNSAAQTTNESLGQRTITRTKANPQFSVSTIRTVPAHDVTKTATRRAIVTNKVSVTLPRNVTVTETKPAYTIDKTETTPAHDITDKQSAHYGYAFSFSAIFKNPQPIKPGAVVNDC